MREECQIIFPELSTHKQSKYQRSDYQIGLTCAWLCYFLLTIIPDNKNEQNILMGNFLKWANLIIFI